VEGYDITVVNKNIETVLLRERVEFILEVLSVLDIFFKTEHSPLFEVNRLGHNLSENVSVIESLA